jgi:hypothetical protein
MVRSVLGVVVGVVLWAVGFYVLAPTDASGRDRASIRSRHRWHVAT